MYHGQATGVKTNLPQFNDNELRKSLGRNNGRINDPNFQFYYGWLSIKWQESWVIAVHEKKKSFIRK